MTLNYFVFVTVSLYIWNYNSNVIRAQKIADDPPPQMPVADPDDFNSEEVSQERADEPSFLTSTTQPDPIPDDNNGDGNIEIVTNTETGEDDGCDDSSIRDNYTFVALIDIIFTDGCKRTCTGCIIHDNVVITAAHCFTMIRDKFLQPELSLSFVVIGTKRMFETGYEQYLPIERVVTHPRFKGWTADLALVFTFANMYSDKSGQILPLALEKSSVPVDSNVTVLSWGKCKKDVGESDARLYVQKEKGILSDMDKQNYEHYEYKETTQGHKIYDSDSQPQKSAVTINTFASDNEEPSKRQTDGSLFYQRYGGKQNEGRNKGQRMSVIRPRARPSQYKGWDQPKSHIDTPRNSMYFGDKTQNKERIQYSEAYRPLAAAQKTPDILVPRQQEQIHVTGQPSYDNIQLKRQKQQQNQPEHDKSTLQKQLTKFNKKQQRLSNSKNKMSEISSLSAENKNTFSSVFKEDNDDQLFGNHKKTKWSNATNQAQYVKKIKRKFVPQSHSGLQIESDTRRNKMKKIDQAIESFFDLQDYDGQTFVSPTSNKTPIGDEPFLEIIKNNINRTKNVKQTIQPSLHQQNSRSQRVYNQKSFRSVVAETLQIRSPGINEGKTYKNTEQFYNRRNVRNMTSYQQNEHPVPTNYQGNLDKAAFQYLYGSNGRFVRNNSSKNTVRRQMPRFHQMPSPQHYKNWRRTIGSQHNNLTIGIFGYVNIASCKKMIERTLPPLYEIRNKNEHLCYASEDFYITNEDSGAPVVQNGELVAVTVGGIDSEGEHVAVGIKVSCFCNWIVSNLPNEDGAKLKCCKNCCNDKQKHEKSNGDSQNPSRFKFRNGENNARFLRTYSNEKRSKYYDGDAILAQSYKNGERDGNSTQPEFDNLRKRYENIENVNNNRPKWSSDK